MMIRRGAASPTEATGSPTSQPSSADREARPPSAAANQAAARSTAQSNPAANQAAADPPRSAALATLTPELRAAIRRYSSEEYAQALAYSLLLDQEEGEIEDAAALAALEAKLAWWQERQDRLRQNEPSREDG